MPYHFGLISILFMFIHQITNSINYNALNLKFKMSSSTKFKFKYKYIQFQNTNNQNLYHLKRQLIDLIYLKF